MPEKGSFRPEPRESIPDEEVKAEQLTIDEERQKRQLLNELGNAALGYALSIIDKHRPSERVLRSPDVQVWAKRRIESDIMSFGGLRHLGVIDEALQRFSLTQEFLQDPKIKDAATWGISYLVADRCATPGDFPDLSAFQLSEDEIRSAAIRGIGTYVDRVSWQAEGRDDRRPGFSGMMGTKARESAGVIPQAVMDQYGLSPDDVEEGKRQGFVLAMGHGQAKVIKHAIDTWKYSDDEVRRLLPQGLARWFDNQAWNEPHRTKELIKEFEIDDATLASALASNVSDEARPYVFSHAREWLKSSEEVKEYFIAAFSRLPRVTEPTPWIFERLIEPTVKAQGIGAFRALDVYADLLFQKAVVTPKDIDVLKRIVTTQGVRAVDSLLFIEEGITGVRTSMSDEDDFDDFWREEEVPSKFLNVPLSENPHLGGFLEDLPAIAELYLEYVGIQEDGSLSNREKKEHITQLQERVEIGKRKILEGSCDDNDVKDPTYVALLYHAFPPATTLDRGQYRRLLAERADRSGDLPRAWHELNLDLAKSTFVSATGSYRLKEGEKLDIAPWEKLAAAIDEGNGATDTELDERTRTESQVRLGTLLLESSLDERSLPKKTGPLLIEIYKTHRALNGVAFTTERSHRKHLLEMQEYADDRMKDTVDTALDAFARERPADYKRLVKRLTEVVVSDKAKKGIVRNMVDVLTTLSLDARQTNERLKAILSRYNIQVEGDILDMAIAAIESVKDEHEAEEGLKDFLVSLLERAGQERRPGKLSSEIVRRLLGNDLASMKRELGKYEFAEDVSGEERSSFRLAISKKRAHSVAGLNSGVCVAVDDRLWNKPEFSNVILWDEQGIARGGMHFEVVKDGEDTYLSLPGINPSISALSKANPDTLYESMISFAKDAARAIQAKSILIPTSSAIHSNRSVIQSLIDKRAYPVRTLAKDHDFSYDPYAYRWKDGYEIEIE